MRTNDRRAVNFKDYYKILGLPPDADDLAIRDRCDLLEALCDPALPPGERAASPVGLADDVARARKTLLDPAARFSYNKHYFANRPDLDYDFFGNAVLDPQEYSDEDIVAHYRSPGASVSSGVKRHMLVTGGTVIFMLIAALLLIRFAVSRLIQAP